MIIEITVIERWLTLCYVYVLAGVDMFGMNSGPTIAPARMYPT